MITISRRTRNKDKTWKHIVELNGMEIARFDHNPADGIVVCLKIARAAVEANELKHLGDAIRGQL